MVTTKAKRRVIPSPLGVSLETIYPFFATMPDTAILDSSLVNELGQYKIIAAVPYKTITSVDGRTYVDGRERPGSLTDYVHTYLQDHYDENETDLPIVSGAVGYISYDYGREAMGIPTRHERDVLIPDALLRFYDFFAIENCHTKDVWFVANGKTERAEKLLQRLLRRIRQYLRLPIQPDRLSLMPEFHVQAMYTQGEYKEAIRRLIDYIVAGDVYIANLTHQLTVTSPIQPFTLFDRLRHRNPAPFSAYLHDGSFQIISSSMERFLRIRHGVIETRPIKGTRPRSTDPEKDQAMRRELEQSEKDKSELLMIVDLERNDMNKVCQPGSVEVPRLFSLEEYATVFHLVADVTGRLRDGVSVIDAFMALFPGGSITGAPKYRAMEIIDELERCRRNLYTGAIGYMTLDGDCDFNIVIRTALHYHDQYRLGVGGGITCESDPDLEYRETMQKAKALLQALH